MAQTATVPEMTPPDNLSAQVSLLTLATTNAKLANDQGVIGRYNDTYRSDPTEVYYLDASFTAGTLWPQKQIQTPVLTSFTATTPTNLPAKIPQNQYVSIMKTNLLCRFIQSYKNASGAYWIYDVLSTQGETLFTVSLPNNTPSTQRLRVGGMKFNPSRLTSICAADIAAAPNGGMFGSGSGATTTIIQGLATAAVPRDGPTNISSSFTYLDREYVYGDQQMAAAAGTTNGSAAGAGTTQVGCNGFPLTAAQLGSSLTGGYIFYFVSPPSLPGSGSMTYTINMYSYNEQEEYLSSVISGIVTSAKAIAGCSFAYLPVPADDYNRFEIVLQSSVNGATEFSIGILYVATGEGWAHIPTLQVDTVLGEIEGSSWLATNQLISNTTAELYKAGLQAGVQPANRVEWQSIVDNGDPFTHVTQVLKAESLSFKKGGYSWLRGTSDQDYAVKEEVVQASTNPNSSGDSDIYRTQLDAQPFFAHVINNNSFTNGVLNVQDFLMHIYETGEFTTDTKWRHPLFSQWNPLAWTMMAESIKHIPQLTENDLHDFITTIGAGLKKAGSIGARAITNTENILAWLKRAQEVGGKVAPLVAPLLAAL